MRSRTWQEISKGTIKQPDDLEVLKIEVDLTIDDNAILIIDGDDVRPTKTIPFLEWVDGK